MKQGECVQYFVNRILDIVYQIRVMKEELPQKVVMSKLLRSLTPRFSQVVHSIIVAKDLSTLTVEELSGLLMNHELILNIEGNYHEGEKVLHVVRGSTQFSEHQHRGGKGRGRHFPRGRGCGRSRSIDSGSMEPSCSVDSDKQYEGVQCFVNKKYGHVKASSGTKIKKPTL